MHETVVAVSGPMLLQEFARCEDFISECKGRCCESSIRPEGILVTIHPYEARRIKGFGGTIENGRLVAKDKRCPFKTDENFCSIHHKGKPFGCSISPFTLNKTGMLVVRNRYRCLKCYRADTSPACDAHRGALNYLFGFAQAEQLSLRAKAGIKRMEAQMPRMFYDMLRENDAAK